MLREECEERRVRCLEDLAEAGRAMNRADLMLADAMTGLCVAVSLLLARWGDAGRWWRADCGRWG